jgi:hypothetical protein
MRAFKTAFVVFVEPADAIYNGEREKDKPLTLEEVKSYLNMALLLDWDREGQGDPIGIQGMQVSVDELEECSCGPETTSV